MKKLVNFVFGNEKGSFYQFSNLNCTQEKFFEWLEKFNYGWIESKYGYMILLGQKMITL